MTESLTESSPKKIVYLFGTGAAHAESLIAGSNIDFLMKDVKDGMWRKLKKNKDVKKYAPSLINELIDDDTDVEQLITLYESSGINSYSKVAKILKQAFWEILEEKVDSLPGERYLPKLYSALIDLHEVEDLKENIVGILTLNYEDLLERGVQEIKGCVDYSIKATDNHSDLKLVDNASYQILKLHGSFNWKNEFPITLIDDDKIKDSEDVLWIPPGVEKRSEKYPFNVLWGRAKEVLDCDILRIVGCSLNRNDWQLVSLLYITQQLNTHKKPYAIELINFPVVCDSIKENYKYLNFTLISEIKEVRDFVIRTIGIKEKSEEETSVAVVEFLEKANIFDIWLQSKGEFLRSSNISMSTENGFFERFIGEGI